MSRADEDPVLPQHQVKHKDSSVRDNDCDTCYRLVTEVTYDQECDNIVQHVCEELYHVPVPVRHVPVPVRHVSDHVTPRPIFTPASGSRIPRSSHRLRGTTPGM